MTVSRSRRDAHAHGMLMTERREEDLVGIGWLPKLLLPCHQDQSSRLNNTSYIKPSNSSIRSYKRRRAYARFHRRQVIISLTQRISQKHNVRRNKGTQLDYHYAISSVVVWRVRIIDIDQDELLVVRCDCKECRLIRR
jgi:hypothetical protein